MQNSLVESAELEIRRFVPPSLLQGVDFGAIGIDELVTWVAKARYVQKMEINLLEHAIAEVFGD